MTDHHEPPLTPPGPPPGPASGAPSPYTPPYPTDPAAFGLRVSPRAAVPPPGPALAWAALACAAGLTGVVVLTGLLAWPAMATYRDAAESGTSSLEVITPYDVVGTLLLPGLVLSYILTCLWLTQARTYATRMEPGFPHARSEVWVWLGWLVPFVAIWFPFQVVRDILAASSRGRDRGGPVIGLWWAAWLVLIMSQNIASQLLPVSGPPDPGRVGALGPVSTVSAVAAVVAMGCWTLLVLRILRAQSSSGA